jgi:integrase
LNKEFKLKKGKHRTKGTLRFALKEPNSNTQSPIQFVFSLGNSRVRKSIGYKVLPKYWDKEKQRVKSVIQASNKDEINRELNELESFINDEISNLRRTQSLIVRKDIEGILSSFKKSNSEEENEVINFFYSFENFIKIKDSRLPRNRGNQNQTVEAYKQTLGFLRKFQKELGYEVVFEKIDLEFYYEFLSFMQSIKKSNGYYYSLNTIGKHFKNLKTFLNFAVNVGHNNTLMYKLSEFKIIKEQTTAVYLTKNEKKDLFEFDFSNYPKLEEARDIFIIGCEIGQRVSDYNNLGDAEIVSLKKKNYFKLNQKKTGILVYCFITDAIESIMKSRYNGLPPKSITKQYLNSRIKQAAQMAGINKIIKFERTEGGKRVIRKIPKHELISSHTARRTFCTLLHNEGLTIHKIMTQSGHKTEKEFKNYIRVSKESEVHLITDEEEFKNAFISVD